MKSYIGIILVLSFSTLVACNSNPPATPSTTSTAVKKPTMQTDKGLLVQFNDGTNSAQVETLLQRYDSRILRSYSHNTGLYHISTPRNMSHKEALKKLSAESIIRYAEPNSTLIRR